MLHKRNELIVRYLKKWPSSQRNITALFFSESRLNVSHVNMWRNTFEGVASFELIDTANRGIVTAKGMKYGYEYMCRFFMLDVYDLMVARNIDYYWRCDADCFLIKLTYDIFDWMTSNHLEYGYVVKAPEEHKATKDTLPMWVSKYVNECAIIPTALLDSNLSVPLHFYNNFHVASASFFLRPDVRHFLTSVEKSGFIYSHRWGDAPIQAYAVRLFMNSSATKHIPNLEYVHGSHRLKLSTSGSTYVMKGIVGAVLGWNVSAMKD
jgi:hypothetical protein